MSILRRLNKVICLVLIICIMCFSVFGDFNTQKVYAFALTSTTIAVICCVMVACGIISTNSENIVNAAESFKYWLDSKAAASSGEKYQTNLSDINAMASAWVGGAPMIVNGELKNSLREWANDNGYVSGATNLNSPQSIGAITFNHDIAFNGITFSQVVVDEPFITIKSYDNISTDISNPTPFFNGTYIAYVGNLFYFFYDLENNYYFRWEPVLPFSFYVNCNSYLYSSEIGTSFSLYNLGITLGSSIVTTSTVINNLTVNSDLFPSVTGNTGTTVVTPDWPVTTSSDGTKSVSIPSTLPNIETIPAVGTASGSLTSTGEGTGIFEGIGSMVLDIPIVGTIAQALANIYSLLSNFFNIDNFELDFSSLKLNMLPKVFPFCIPFDFVNLVKMFSVDSSAFVFEINYSNTYFTINHTVDLNPFRIPILFFRYVVVAWFSYILISKTRTLIKW